MRYALLISVFLLSPPPLLTSQARGQAPADGQTSPEQRLANLQSRPLQTFNNVELADYIELRVDVRRASGATYDPIQEVRHFALKATGQSFRLNAARFDLSESDCVVFVERTLAMALARNWESYRLLCDRLRHKDGKVDYKERNFSTLGDWLPNNQWLLEDITDLLIPGEGNPAETFTHIVRPKIFEDRLAAPNSKFTKTIFKGSNYRVPGEVRQDTHIPAQNVHDVLLQLRDGDVVLLLRNSSQNHLSCTHMGIVVLAPDGQPQFTSSGPRIGVKAVPLDGLAGIDYVRGFKFLRLLDNADERISIEMAQMLNNAAIVSSPREEDEKVSRLRGSRTNGNTNPIGG